MSENKKDLLADQAGNSPGGGMHVGEKPRIFKNSIKKLGRAPANTNSALYFVVLFAGGQRHFSIIGPKVLGNATTEIFNGLVSKISGGAGIDFEKIAEILLTLPLPVPRKRSVSLHPGRHHGQYFSRRFPMACAGYLYQKSKSCL